MVGQPTASGRIRKTKAELASEVQELKARLAALEARANPTQRQNTSEFLSEGLDEAFESISDGIAFFDTPDQLVLCNESYRRSLGPHAEALKRGMMFEDVVRLRVESGLISAASENSEEWIRHRMSFHRRGHHQFEPRVNADGRWILVNEYNTASGATVLIRTDVTDRVLAEEALRDSEERFRAAFEGTPAGLMLRTADRKVRLINSALCNMLGFSQEEMQSINLHTLIPPEDWARVEELHSLLEIGEIGNAIVEDRLI